MPARAAVLVIILAAAANGAWCQTFWVNDGVGNWMVSSNWSAGVPNLNSAAQINNGGTARLFDPTAGISGLTLGNSVGNSGTLEVLGGSVAVRSSMFVGLGGIGAVTIANGGVITPEYATSGAVIGTNSGSTGSVVIEGTGSRLSFGSLSVGQHGTGTLSILSGGRVVIASTFVAASIGTSSSSSSGTVNVDGVNSMWQNADQLQVGAVGRGELNILNGGLVENTDGNVGQSSSGDGTVTVAGSGSWWKNSGVAAIGVNGTGTMTISDGGQVTSVNGRIGREPTSTGTVTIDGLGSEWSCSGVVTVGATGATLPSTASLTLSNGGSVTANGGLTVQSGGKLQGDGFVIANVTNFGVVTPEVSSGTIGVFGNYGQHFIGRTEIALASAADFSRLVVSGNSDLAGELRVALVNDFVPLAGAAFDVLDWGTRSGTFSVVNLPPLPAPLSWNTAQLYTDGIISVTSPFLAADFDENGPVNAADLTTWKSGFGTPAGATHMQGDADADGDADGADFLVWQQQFGRGPANPPANPVPEPAALVLLIVAEAGWWRRRRTA